MPCYDFNRACSVFFRKLQKANGFWTASNNSLDRLKSKLSKIPILQISILKNFRSFKLALDQTLIKGEFRVFTKNFS